ncbi:MAG: rhodanese-related sulfurtransferase [Bacteroidetes bacterium]|nr:rhodanese-related sulfurtransferase [Bacteroidota bacterium]
MKDYRVLLFYKYVDVDEPGSIVNEHLDWCLANDIKGRVFFAEEGVNGTVSGKIEHIERYKSHLTSYPMFNDIWFKEDEVNEHAFKKMHVRLKNEIVHSALNGTSLKNGGKRLDPKKLKEFYDSGKDFIIIDARNQYESEIGRFKNAITPPIKNFRGWKQAIEDLEEHKDKTMVTYCTGGIRCEKASAYMVEQGFKDVYQLDGGIHNFINQFPDTYWEGGMFVFDERRVVTTNTKEELKHIAKCYFCLKPTTCYINCHNQDCDKLFVCCHDCKVEQDYCCSDECRNSTNKRQTYHG